MRITFTNLYNSCKLSLDTRYFIVIINVHKTHTYLNFAPQTRVNGLDLVKYKMSRFSDCFFENKTNEPIIATLQKWLEFAAFGNR